MDKKRISLFQFIEILRCHMLDLEEVVGTGALLAENSHWAIHPCPGSAPWYHGTHLRHGQVAHLTGQQTLSPDLKGERRQILCVPWVWLYPAFRLSLKPEPPPGAAQTITWAGGASVHTAQVSVQLQESL